MKIGLLQCDHVGDDFQHIISDYPSRFIDVFGQHAPHIVFEVYDVCHGLLPESPDECEGYLISGSRYSVYDDVPWIHALTDFVRTLHEHKQKTVGICFGHQMIAHALGGKVEKTARGWGIGIKPVQITQSKSWMQPGLSSYNLLLSHQDQVEELPAGADVLGSNAHCPASIFTVGEHFLGIQAHPEFTVELADALMVSRTERIGADVVNAAKATLTMPTHEAPVVQWIQSFLLQNGISHD